MVGQSAGDTDKSRFTEYDIDFVARNVFGETLIESTKDALYRLQPRLYCREICLRHQRVRVQGKTVGLATKNHVIGLLYSGVCTVLPLIALVFQRSRLGTCCLERPLT
jgi:hypothetical protein